MASAQPSSMWQLRPSRTQPSLVAGEPHHPRKPQSLVLWTLPWGLQL